MSISLCSSSIVQWLDELLLNESRAGLTVCLLRGEGGMGQEETLKEWESGLRKVDYRRCLSVHDQYQGGEYAPISSALGKVGINTTEAFITPPKANDSLESQSITDHRGLLYKENMGLRLVEYCQLFESAIIVLHRMQAYPRSTLRLLQNFLRHCRELDRKTIVVADIYDDEDSKELNDEWLEIDSAERIWSEFKEDVIQTRFETWSDRRQEELICSFYPSGIKFHGDSLEKILDTSRGNPTRLKRILLILEDKGVIHSDGSSNKSMVSCNDFDMAVVLSAVHKEILARFNRLDPVLQTVLKQSALIGHKFKRQMLENPLSVPDAYRQLRWIEERSHLIVEEKDEHHIFETRIAWESIRSLLLQDPETYRKGNRILGEYLSSLSTSEGVSYDIAERATHAKNATRHFTASGDYDKALKTIHRASHHFLSIQHFADALSSLEKAKELYAQANQLEHPLLDYWRGECLRELFRFPEAVEAYRLHFRRTSNRKSLIARFMYATCLYNSGFMEEPRKIFHEIESASYDKNGKLSRIGILSLAMLAALEETACNESFRRYYFDALSAASESQDEIYYSLARRATMVYVGEETMKLLTAAKDHFRRNGNRKELAMTLHNMATTMLFAGDLEQCGEWLRESMAILHSYSSFTLSYTGNSLAIWECLTKHNFSGALAMFCRYDRTDQDVFNQIVLKYNQVTCLRNLKRYDECVAILNETEGIFRRAETSQFNHQIRYLPLHRAFLAKDMNQYEEAYMYMEKYWDFKRNLSRPKHYRDIIAAQLTVELAFKLGRTCHREALIRKNADSQEVRRIAACGGLYNRLYYVEE